jgi:site-specific recombinase XerD
VVAALRYTGMRSVELRSLRLDDLDLDRGEVMVRSKSAAARPVLIPRPLRPILQTYLDEIRPVTPVSPLLLVNPHRRNSTAEHGFGSEAIYREVELAGQRAGVAGRHHPHRWRQTYATELVRAGIDIHVVQRLLGHRSISATIGYAHLAVDDLRALTGGIHGFPVSAIALILVARVGLGS